MGGGTAFSSSPRSLPPQCPRSPPVCPDFSGRRREFLKIQLLEREMTFLEGELKYIQGLQPASTCCKEVVEFVDSKSDPFIPIKKKKISKPCRLWKWICKLPCLCLSSTICCCCCCFRPKKPRRGSCNCCCLPKSSCTGCSSPSLPSCCCRQRALPECRCKCLCPCSCGTRCPDCTISSMCSCFSCAKCPARVAERMNIVLVA